MENEEGSTTCGCGSTFNVLCGKVVMHGTTRSFNNEVQQKVRSSVERISIKVAEALNAKATVTWDDVNYGHPATVNSTAETALARAAAVEVVGEGGIRTGKEIMTMGGTSSPRHPHLAPPPPHHLSGHFVLFHLNLGRGRSMKCLGRV